LFTPVKYYIKERAVHLAAISRDFGIEEATHLELPCWQVAHGHYVVALSRGVEMEAARNMRVKDRVAVDELEE
jgi:hypothetical protein